MARLGHFRSGAPLSRCPASLLLFGYLGASILVFIGDWRSLGIQSLVVLGVLRWWTGGLIDFFFSLGRLWWIVALVFISKSSELLFLVDLVGGKNWQQILLEGGLISTRLIVSLGLVYGLTYNLSQRDIRDTISRIIRPFSPAKARSFSLSIMILFSALPHLLSYSRDILNAQKLRGIRPRRRPFLVARTTALGILRESGIWSIESSQALTLRGAQAPGFPRLKESTTMSSVYKTWLGLVVFFFVFTLGYWVL